MLKLIVSLSLIHAASIHWKRPSRVIAPSPIDARLPGRCRKAAARSTFAGSCGLRFASPLQVASRGRLAQLVERFLYTEDVGGSSPSSPTSLRSRSEQDCRAEAPSGKGGHCSASYGSTSREARVTYVYVLQSLEHDDRFYVG